LKLSRYKGLAFGALAVKSLPLAYGASVILFVNTHLPRDTELGVYSLAIATFFALSLAGKSFALFPLIKFQAEGAAVPGVWTAGVTYWTGTQLVGALGVWLLAPHAPGIFRAPGLDTGMRWAAAIILTFIPRDLVSALLQSRRQMGRLFVLEAFYFLAAAVGIIILALMGSLSTANQVLAINLGAGLLSTLAAPFLVWGTLPTWARPQSAVWKRTALYGRDSLGIGVGDLAYNQLDYHLLGLFTGPAQVALYFAAKNFFRFYNAVTQAINLLIFPTSSNLYARGEIAKLKELVEKVLSAQIGLLVIINIGVLLSADWIVAVVYQGKFPDAAGLLRLFSLASFFEPLYMVSENVLYGIGKPRAVLIAMWSSIVIFVLLAATLMPRFGAQGGALTILGTLLSLAVITLIFLHRELHINPVTIMRRGLSLTSSILRR
jgi:O-antigen/teichoic acid export membrane protein